MDTEDRDKSQGEVIDFAKAQDLKTPRQNNTRPKGAGKHQVNRIREMCRDEIRRSEAARVTPEEEAFCLLLVSGASMADAYLEAYPEKCWRDITDEQGVVVGREPALSYQARFDRGNRLSKQSHIRAKIITLLEQEEGDVSHTSRRLDNLILKNLEKEATDPTNTPMARISALKQLQAHRAIQVSERQAAERAQRDLAPEELIERIHERIQSLSKKG